MSKLESRAQMSRLLCQQALARQAETGTSKYHKSNVTTQTSRPLTVYNTTTVAPAQLKVLISMEVFWLPWRNRTLFASDHRQVLAVSVLQLILEQPLLIPSACPVPKVVTVGAH